MKTNNIPQYDVCIIGGGAAGLFCAANIKKFNPYITVAVLERQKDVGRKLLATGNGRCNLTNLYADATMYHGSFKSAAEHLLNLCPPDLITEIFNEFGMLTTCDSEGRVYPYSKHSASVLDCLKNNCISRGVEIVCNCNINDILKNNNTYQLVDTNNNKFICNKLIVASGSKATPETGADDSILHIIAEKLCHNITPLIPALCPVPVKSKNLFQLKGVRANGTAAIFVNGNEVKKENGEIQFTDKTLSGICLFNLSRIANTNRETYIRLSLLPHMNEYEITEMLSRIANSIVKESSAENLLSGIFQRKLAYVLLKEAGIGKERVISTITKEELRKLARLINNWDFPVIPSNDFTRAQVVAGGINGDELCPETMESKINKNLYFIGEATDCDGDCGGLNLQFAFASGYCAALDITK